VDEYDNFKKWKSDVDDTGVSNDDLMLAYLIEQKNERKLCPTTLNQRFSFVKSCMNNEEAKEVSFIKTSKYLKNSEKKHKKKKASVFSRQEIERFLAMEAENLKQIKLIFQQQQNYQQQQHLIHPAMNTKNSQKETISLNNNNKKT